MELSERLIQVKSTTKHEKDFPSFTQDDVVFLFGDVTRPLGLILNYNDPLECYVLFPPATSMQEIAKLAENPSWVGTSMQPGLHKPSSSMLAIASRPLQGRDWRRMRNMNIFPSNHWILGFPKIIQPLKRMEDLLLLMLCHLNLAHANTGNSAAFDISPTGDED